MQRKIWAAADFQNFLARPNTRRPRKKRRLVNAEPRSTEPRRQMLLTTSWSQTSQAGLFWGYPGLELDTGIFPFVFFLDTALPRSSNLILKKKMPYRESQSEPGARRSNSCLVFVWQLECLNGNRPLRLFTGGTSRRSERLRIRSPTLGHFSHRRPIGHVRKQSLPVWHDERNKTIHALANCTGTCSAVAKLIR